MRHAIMCLRFAVLAGLTLLLEPVPQGLAAEPAAEPIVRQTYAWRNLAMGGGGYVTGIVAHPKEANLIYVRTDVGGAYRFSATPDAQGRNWIPITDHFKVEEWNYYGIESITIDPTDTNVVYIAAGKFDWAGDGRVFRSDDRGQSWTPLPLSLPMTSNGSYRSSGERLAVDPHHGKTVYFGSRTEGLWRSDDRGQSWKRAGKLPAKPQDGIGITFVLANPHEGGLFNRGPSPIFVGLFGQGVAQSLDKGKTLTMIGGPKRPMRAALSKSGGLIVTSQEGVFRWDGTRWSDITPKAGRAYGAIDVSPHNPKTLVTSEWGSQHGLPFYLSTDDGRTWDSFTVASGRVDRRPNVPWWPSHYFASATAAMVFDPKDRSRLWLVDWYGIWFTPDFKARNPTFRTLQRGHEEMVTMTLSTPPSGAWLLSGVGDNNGFRHEAIDVYPESAFESAGLWNTHGIDYHEADAKRMVRVGTRGPHGDESEGAAAVSQDGGVTWKPIPWPYKGQPLKVAYAARNPDVFVVLPRLEGPKRTTDGGQTWEDGEGVNAGPLKRFWSWDHPLAADRREKETFYLLSAGQFYRSTDGGKTWQKGATLPQGGVVYVEASPETAREVWVSVDQKGLFLSRDGGDTFTQIPKVKRAMLMALGPSLPSKLAASVYLFGVIEGMEPHRIFRSDSSGARWIAIDDPAIPIGDQPNIMRVDRQQAGRVAIGTNGRGIFVGVRP